MTAPHTPTITTAFDKASDRLIDALACLDRMHLKDAVANVREAMRILETEEQFRDARKGMA